MGINEYDELRGENIALRKEAEELRAQLEIAHGALDESETAIAAAREEGRAAGYGEAIEQAAVTAEAEYMSLSGHPDFRNAKFIAKRIRMLAPAATTKEPK